MFQVQDGSIMFNHVSTLSDDSFRHFWEMGEDPQPQEAAQMKAGGAAANEVELPLSCSPKSMGSSVNHMTCAPKKLQFLVVL